MGLSDVEEFTTREFHLMLADHLHDAPLVHVLIHAIECPSMSDDDLAFDDTVFIDPEHGNCIGCGATPVLITDYLKQHAS